MAELKDLVVSGDARIHGNIKADNVFAKTISAKIQKTGEVINANTTLSTSSATLNIKTSSTSYTYTLPTSGITAGLHFEIHNASSGTLDITGASSNKIIGYNYQSTALGTCTKVRLNAGAIAFCTWTGTYWYVQSTGALTKVS